MNSTATILRKLFLLSAVIGLTGVTAYCSKKCGNQCCSAREDYCCPRSSEDTGEDNSTTCQETKVSSECQKIESRPTRFREVMSEMLIAMDLAKTTSTGMVNPLIQYCLDVWKQITPDSEDTQKLLLKWSEMYHEDQNRNPDDYYGLLVETYPNVFAVIKFPSGVFGACFDTFVALQNKYKVFRKELKEDIQRVSAEEIYKIVDEKVDTPKVEDTETEDIHDPAKQKSEL